MWEEWRKFRNSERYIADTTLYWKYTQLLEIHLSTSSFLRPTLNCFSDVGSRARCVFDDLPSFSSSSSPSFPFFSSLSLFLLSAASLRRRARVPLRQCRSIFSRPHHVIQCPPSTRLAVERKRQQLYHRRLIRRVDRNGATGIAS